MTSSMARKVQHPQAAARRPRSQFELPNGRGFIALLEAFRATGGTAPSEVVGPLLSEHQASHAVSLAKLVNTGQIFGFEWRASLWIPMFQFDADSLAVKAGAQRARAALPALWSGWQVASWFAAPGVELDGRCPADMLEQDLDAVMQVACSSVPSQGHGAPFAAARRPQEVASHA